MRKLITIGLLLISGFSFGQSWEGGLSNTLQRQPSAKGYNYQIVTGKKPAAIGITETKRLDSLLALRLLKDSAIIAGKNLFDVPNKTTARLNLGITGLLNLKADDNSVVHKTGEITETITGLKTLTRPINFAGGSVAIDSGGILTNSIRRKNNTVQFLMTMPSEANVVTSMVIQPSKQFAFGSDTSHRRFVSGVIKGLLILRDTLVISDNPVMDYGTYSTAGDINQFGLSTGITSAFYDRHTITSATDYASFRTNIQSGAGYAFKFIGTAPGLTNGDIEIGTIGKGVILKSPNGTRYRITVNNSGTLVVTSL